MSRTILNSEIISDIIKNNEMKFLTKKAKNGYYNYYILPNIGLKLYNAKITWIDNNVRTKNMSFKFIKHENIGLFKLLQYTNKMINDSFYHSQKDISIYFEKDDSFYIKCYLPTTEKLFDNKPRINTILDGIVIDIRNIWESPNKDLGINLELKNIGINLQNIN